VDEDGDILVSEAEHGQILLFKMDGNSFAGPYVVADEGKNQNYKLQKNMKFEGQISMDAVFRSTGTSEIGLLLIGILTLPYLRWTVYVILRIFKKNF